jgi:hypothetical protein
MILKSLILSTIFTLSVQSYAQSIHVIPGAGNNPGRQGPPTREEGRDGRWGEHREDRWGDRRDGDRRDERYPSYPGENRWPQYPGPSYPGSSQTEIIKQRSGEIIRGEGAIGLLRLFNLGSERQGQVIRRITLTARALRGYADVGLQIDGRLVGGIQMISSFGSTLSFETYGERLDYDLRSVRLYIRGDVQIDEVGIELERSMRPMPPGPIPGPFPGPFPGGGMRRIEQFVGQRIYDTAGINLASLMRLDRRDEDLFVDSIDVTLRNSDYGVIMRLCGEGSNAYSLYNCSTPAVLRSGLQVIQLRPLSISRVRDLVLSARMGMIDIERIAINLR